MRTQTKVEMEKGLVCEDTDQGRGEGLEGLVCEDTDQGGDWFVRTQTKDPRTKTQTMDKLSITVEV